MFRLKFYEATYHTLVRMKIRFRVRVSSGVLGRKTY